jgi:hypothetical protein
MDKMLRIAVLGMAMGVLAACSGSGGSDPLTTTEPETPPVTEPPAKPPTEPPPTEPPVTEPPVTEPTPEPAVGVPYPSAPHTDPFYKAPDPLPDVPAGTILNSRAITFAPLLGQPMPNPAWQLQFLSHDAHGRPIAAIATVVKPTEAPTGESSLLAYQFGEDGLSLECAPSRTLAGAMKNVVSQAEGGFPLEGLKKGWTLVYPDHEGPDAAYGVGRLAGHITLDSIRAALRFSELGLSSSTQVGMWGYSGGAIATAWAASLQNSYAPELNIVAVASGGTPADLIGVARNAESNPITNALFFNLVFSAIQGINRVYPNLVTPVLNEKGKAAYESMKDGCLGFTTDGSPVPRGKFSDYTTDAEPFNSEGALEIAPLITLPQPGETPVANTYVFHAINDELIPIKGTDVMVDAWCKTGAHVSYYRGDRGEHALFMLREMPTSALSYLEGRFNGSAVDVLPEGTEVCN